MDGSARTEPSPSAGFDRCGRGVRTSLAVWMALAALWAGHAAGQITDRSAPMPVSNCLTSAALAPAAMMSGVVGYGGASPWLASPVSPAGGQFLPLEVLYPAYLAGPQETRLGTQLFSEDDHGPLWDTTLGGRLGLLRGASLDYARHWQLDVEGAAILRLDPDEDMDLQSVDFRAGVPLTFLWGPHRLRIAYYHLSAHLGDEFILKNPTFERLNYTRDALSLGYSRYLTERMRVYGEASWGFYTEVAEPWQLQFGIERAPTRPTTALGEPFFAINGLLREEVDFGGTATLHVGWAWRDARVGRLLRTGLFVQAGKTHHMSFHDESERQIGVGLWYDF